MIDYHILLDVSKDDHWEALRLDKIGWFDSISIDYLFGGYDDYNPRIFKHIDHFSSLPKDDLKLVLHVAFLPMNIEINLQPNTIKKINLDPNTYLWILTPHEYIFSDEKIVKECKEKNINLKKVIFTSCNDDTKINDTFYCIGITDWHEARYRYNVRSFDNIGFITPEEKQKSLKNASKKYLCLLRNNKPHRISLFYYLNRHDIIKDGYVSYHCPNTTLAGFDKKTIPERLEGAVFLKTLSPKLENTAIKSSFMYNVRELDVLDRIKDNNRKTIEPYYHDSLISIVSESDVYVNFATEKTFKAIAHSHPFVLQGSELIINHLQKNGYKTYETLFETNNFQTYKETEKFLKFLQNISTNELYKKVDEIWDIVYYNYNHFMTRKILIKNLIKKIVKQINKT